MSTNVLNKIEKYVNGILPSYDSIKLVPRPVPNYIDKILKGTTRFSKKSGNNISVFDPDVVAILSEEALVLQRQIKVSSLPSWFVPNSIVQFSPSYETKIVEDVSYSEGIITLTEDINSLHEIGSQIYLCSVPIYVKLDSAVSSIQIVVDSSYFIMIGDQISIPHTRGNINSNIEYEILISTYDSGSDSYILTLNKGINRILTAGDIIYLHANPAYSSEVITIPTGYYSINRDGPFLIDYLSGRLSDSLGVEEFISAQAFDQLGNTLIGTITTPALISKNYIIQDTHLRSDILLFWDLVEGSLQYNKNGYALLLANDKGKFSFYKELIPSFNPGKEWILEVVSTKNITLRCTFNSNVERQATFLNTYLISYTYNSSTGIIQYMSDIDISNVNRGQVFVDSSGNEFTILSTNDSLNQITINSLQNVNCETPYRDFQGSIYIGNAQRCFSLLAGEKKEIIIGTKNYEQEVNRIDISYSPSYVVRNTQLSAYTYDIYTGILTYTGSIDLSSVQPGHSFIDSLDNYFSIISVDAINKRLYLEANLSIATTQPTRIEQGSIVYDFSDSQLAVKDWFLNTNTIFSIAYNVLARTRNNWQATGLILKKMFFNIDNITAKYDAYNKYNGGNIYL